MVNWVEGDARLVTGPLDGSAGIAASCSPESFMMRPQGSTEKSLPRLDVETVGASAAGGVHGVGASRGSAIRGAMPENPSIQVKTIKRFASGTRPPDC